MLCHNRLDAAPDLDRLLSLQARWLASHAACCSPTHPPRNPAHPARSPMHPDLQPCSHNPATPCTQLQSHAPSLHPYVAQALDLTANLLEEEALPLLARLPCLETLYLHDNPLARRQGYWARCAAAFAEARGGGAGAGDGGGGGGAGGGGGGGGAGAGAARASMEKVFVDGVLITHPALALT